VTTSVFNQELFSHSHMAERAKAGIWALALGVVSGLACVGVRLTFRFLQWIFLQNSRLLPQAASLLSPGRRLLTPIVGALCATAVLWAEQRWSQAEPAVEYVEAVRFDGGRIPFASTLWRTISSAFSIATGAAIGREGSMIQFAAAVTSWVGARSPVRCVPLSRQVAYGAAAAVAAAYQAPAAGVFFALEIVLGEWLWIEMPQLALASGAGWLVSRLILGAGPLFVVHSTVSLSTAALWAVPLTLLLGVFGPLYQKLLRSVRFAGCWPLALLWGGLVIGLLSLSHTTVWGNGDVALLNVLKGNEAMASVALILGLRLIATTVCVGSGTVGGVFTPTLFAGASIGLVSAHLLHFIDPILLAIVGLSTLLSAVTHAPFMAAFMAVELTGQYQLFPWLLLLNCLAWLIAKKISNHSLYAIATPAPISS
jgi:CIC family chloride channel protein